METFGIVDLSLAFEWQIDATSILDEGGRGVFDEKNGLCKCFCDRTFYVHMFTNDLQINKVESGD